MTDVVQNFLILVIVIGAAFALIPVIGYLGTWVFTGKQMKKEWSLFNKEVASGKCGFTTLRKSHIKKPNFSKFIFEKLGFFHCSVKAPFNGITKIWPYLRMIRYLLA